MPRFAFVPLALLALLLAACEPTPSPAPTDTPASLLPTATATPTPRPTATPQPVDHVGAVLVQTNEARLSGAACGSYPSDDLPAMEYPPGAALRLSDGLASFAQAHADRMAGASGYGHSPREERRAVGGNGENISRVRNLPPATFVANWLESAGHCHNMMNPEWVSVGVGVAKAGADDYWSWYGDQVFGRE
ncbi:MAG: hypothetical protein F4Z78_10615 [Gammaproteobacteria bacterium]|nr:hypothetical protein [Gammaproteobacteria bacterium]